jgi:class 3 adenylate cyclase
MSKTPTVKKRRHSSGTGLKIADVRTLISSWEQRSENSPWDRAEQFALLGRKAVEFGHAMLACEIFQQGLSRFPAHRQLRYLTALALAKIGSYADASVLTTGLLAQLRRRDPLYAEAKSLEGRIAKDLWARLPDGPQRLEAGRRAAIAYEAAYEASKEYFPGINAATMNVLTGQPEHGRRLAAEVQRLCLRDARRSPKDHWLFATLGEACLLLDDRPAALRWYRRAAAAARNRVGDIATMRRQLRLLGSAVAVDRKAELALRVPQIAFFTGHMLDKPNRITERFPAYIEPQVTAAIAAALSEMDAGFGYCSAACGADILFIEQMQLRGAEVHVVLPFDRGDFLDTSVRFAGEGWIQRFEHALRRATSVSYAVQERHLGDDMLFEYTASLSQGAALLRARQLGSEALLLTVVDEADKERPGGTKTALAAWEKLGLPTRKIDLGTIRAQAARARKPDLVSPPGGPAPEQSAIRTGTVRRQIKTMLFADMVGFSKLQEEDTPAFLVHFLGEIARVIVASEVPPAFQNTWGDGLFMVFDQVTVGAEFALRLRDAVRRADWRAHGLPPDTAIRIGMHCGPVFPAVDPIIGRSNYFGSHVNRAARIEPITAAGAVYISEQMAALLTASGAAQFDCDFLGSIPLAKHFGDSILYRLRRADESE